MLIEEVMARRQGDSVKMVGCSQMAVMMLDRNHYTK